MARKKQDAPPAAALAPAADPTSAGGFRGFGTQALPFLQALAANNDRDWFAINKPTYFDECDAPLRELVRAVGVLLEQHQIPLAPMTRNPVFRIYRDVRFSKNKLPYKTHVGAAFHPLGDKSRPGLLYIHVEPARSFLAAGFYQPDAPLLRAYRAAILADPPSITQVVESLATHGLSLDPGDPLARMPRGFEGHPASPLAPLVRKRSLTTTQPLRDDDLERRDLPEVILRFATAALPLLEFFWEVAERGD